MLVNVYVMLVNVYIISDERHRVVVLLEDVLVAEEEVDVPLEAVLVQWRSKPGTTSSGIGVHAF